MTSKEYGILENHYRSLYDTKVFTDENREYRKKASYYHKKWLEAIKKESDQIRLDYGLEPIFNKK